MSQKEWQAAEIITNPDNCEAIEYGLMEAGAVGTETIESDDQMRILGYFANSVDEPRLRNALREALRVYSCESDTFQLNITQFADRDWLAEWKQNWHPVEVGRFIVAPPWIPEPGALAIASDEAPVKDPVASTIPRAMRLWGPRSAPGSDILIRINPGMAFGTGTHETTRLCLKAIERHFHGGSFLDVGTGTGILAIAAAKMCQKLDCEGRPPTIMACDIDPDAIEVAKQNARLNDVLDRIQFFVGSVDEQTASADLVCANLTAPVIVELLPALLSVSCGRSVISGILDTQFEIIKARLLELAVVDFEIEQDGEWIAIVI